MSDRLDGTSALVPAEAGYGLILPTSADAEDLGLVETDCRAIGSGALSGEDPLKAAALVFGELGSAPGVPFLPLLPERGPGADPIGRAASLLVDLPVDLQPAGWRLVDHPGRDLQRAVAFLTADTDALAEAADGYRGPLLVSVAGPWTLAGTVWLQRGERIACDPGAARDLAASLAEGVAGHLETVRRLVPAASVIVQVDEPGLPAALEGRLPTASGFGRLRAVESAVAQDTLRQFCDRLRQAGAAAVVLRCATAHAPLPVLRGAEPDGLGLTVSRLTPRNWEGVAIAVESGVRLVAGLLDPTAARLPSEAAVLEPLRDAWNRVGLAVQDLRLVDIAPAAPLLGLPPSRLRPVLDLALRSARALSEVAQE